MPKYKSADMHQAIALACATEQESGLQKKGGVLAPPFLEGLLGMPLIKQL